MSAKAGCNVGGVCTNILTLVACFWAHPVLVMCAGLALCAIINYLFSVNFHGSIFFGYMK